MVQTPLGDPEARRSTELTCTDAMLPVQAPLGLPSRGAMLLDVAKGGGRGGGWEVEGREEGSTHWQVRILKSIDDFLEEAAEDGAAASAVPELNFCILPCHPAGLGPQMAEGAVKAGHDMVQKQPLQLVLVRGLDKTGAPVRSAEHQCILTMQEQGSTSRQTGSQKDTQAGM